MNRCFIFCLVCLLFINCGSLGIKHDDQTSFADSLIAKVYIEPPRESSIGTDSQAIYFENSINPGPGLESR